MNLRNLALGFGIVSAGACDSIEAERREQVEGAMTIAVATRDGMIGYIKLNCQSNDDYEKGIKCSRGTAERPPLIPENYLSAHFGNRESPGADELLLAKSGGHAFRLKPFSDEGECTIGRTVSRQAITKEAHYNIVYPTKAECNEIRKAAMTALELAKKPE